MSVITMLPTTLRHRLAQFRPTGHKVCDLFILLLLGNPVCLAQIRNLARPAYREHGYLTGSFLNIMRF